MRGFLALTLFGLFSISWTARADVLGNYERSIFFGFHLGSGLNPDIDVRSPVNHVGETPEAYSLGAFVFGIYGGYRFNEVLGVDLAWTEQRHIAHTRWGGVAYYQLVQTAFRLSLPLPSRQTVVFRLAPAIGSFSYGDSTPGFVEDNSTLVVGGLAGMVLEHEFLLGVVGILEISYLPLYRKGKALQMLYDDYLYDDVLPETYEKNFTDEFVQLIWISAGFQFEWTFR